MSIYKCLKCNFSTPNKYNYSQHLKTKKHLSQNQLNAPKNEQNKQKNVHIEQENEQNEHKKMHFNTEQNLHNAFFAAHLVCHYCCKEFSRPFNLRRHVSVCKINNESKIIQQNPKNVENEQKNVENDHKKRDFICQFCSSCYSTQSNLNKHIRKCLAKESELDKLKSNYEQKLLETETYYQHKLETEQAINSEKEKTIDKVTKMKPVVTNNITNNKTIQFLNQNYGDMIEMEQFLYNLEHTEQLTHEECASLLYSYKDNGLEMFARNFSHIMKENCKRQLLKEGIQGMELLPLYCSDGNLRSHKEKHPSGWKTHYDNHSINTMINISSDQVYKSHHQSMMIFGKQRNKIYKQIKQDNHSQKIKGISKIKDK